MDGIDPTVLRGLRKTFLDEGGRSASRRIDGLTDEDRIRADGSASAWYDAARLLRELLEAEELLNHLRTQGEHQ